MRLDGDRRAASEASIAAALDRALWGCRKRATGRAVAAGASGSVRTHLEAAGFDWAATSALVRARSAAIALLVLVVLTGGCSFASPAPIRERPWWISDPGPGFCVTSFGRIYVPPGHLAEFTVEPIATTAAALMVHEQVHASDQHAGAGMLWWSFRYSTGANFRWAAEQRGYQAQIDYLAAHGFCASCLRAWFVLTVASPFYLGMVNEDVAKAWFDARYPPGAGLVRHDGLEPIANPFTVRTDPP